jgi:uncharacterized repeat protein (TIGR02543 family)
MRYQFLTAGIIAAILFSLIGKTAHAATTRVACSLGGNFTIEDNVVTANAACRGNVPIPASVTNIGDRAFSNSTLTNVTFATGSKLATIGDYAFYEVRALTAITIPASVTFIGGHAFRRSGLTAITIPENVTNIGAHAFDGTGVTNVTFAAGSQLTSIGFSAFFGTRASTIIIPASVTSIEAQAFSGATNLTNVTFAEGSKLATIGDAAFYFASALKSLVIPASVTSIGAHAFYGTKALTKVTFTAGSQLKSIGEMAFAGDTFDEELTQYAMTSITIPASVISIGTGAFWGARTLSKVTFASGSKLSTIGSVAFTGSGLTNITIPAGVKIIGDQAFLDSTSLSVITVDKSNAVYASLDGVLFNKSLTELIHYPVGKVSDSYRIPSSVITIGSRAFWKANALKSVSIPSSVRSVQEYAFFKAGRLTTVTFAAGSKLTSIGSHSFSETGLTAIAIPANVATIEENAFAGAKSIKSLTIPASVKSIGEYAFCGATGLTTVTFAAGSQLTSIGMAAFYETRLKTITIPASVTSIAELAFAYASGLKTVTFAAGSKLKIIGGSAFASSALTSIMIPANVTSIEGAFLGAHSLATIRVDSASVTFASADGVLYNKSLTQLLQYPVRKLGDSFNIPASVEAIGDSAFFETRLSAINIPASVKYFGSTAFFGASSLTSITVPASVISIGQQAFDVNGAMKRVYFLGNMPLIGMQSLERGIGANAFIRSTATGYPAVGANMAGLTVAEGVYTLAFDSMGGSEISPGYWLRDVEIRAPTPPTRIGYTFAGWAASSDATAVTFPYTPPNVGDLTLYAKWIVSIPTQSATSTRPATRTATNTRTPTRVATTTRTPTRTETTVLTGTLP